MGRGSWYDGLLVVVRQGDLILWVWVYGSGFMSLSSWIIDLIGAVIDLIGMGLIGVGL